MKKKSLPGFIILVIFVALIFATVKSIQNDFRKNAAPAIEHELEITDD